jgi:hypothetical protein
LFAALTGRPNHSNTAHGLARASRLVAAYSLGLLAHEIAQTHPFAPAQAERAVNQTMYIQGFYPALQSVFGIHQTDHGNALSVGDYPILTGLAEMKQPQS